MKPEITTIAQDLRDGHIAQAFAACQNLLKNDPNNVEAIHLMGVIALRQNDLSQAIEWLHRAIENRGDVAEFHHDLAMALSRSNHLAEAIEAMQRAVDLAPHAFAPTMNLTRELARAGRHTQAEAMGRRALALRPNSIDARIGIAAELRKQRRLREALAMYLEAFNLNPARPAGPMSSVAGLLEQLGRIQEATAWHRRATCAAPKILPLHSNYLYALRYLKEEHDPHVVFREHVGWAKQLCEPLYHSMPPAQNDPMPERKLRIAYLSADFRRHSASNGIEPLVHNHNRADFDVWCYNDAPKCDDVTERFKAAADQWREVRGLEDAKVAQMIRDDQIDILIDHTGHMGGNRMMVFARRPAPVQISFPGYPGTTGLKTIDAFITDAYQDPPGKTEQFYSEKLIRLSGSPRSYRPPVDAPELTPPSVEINDGRITFGVVQRPSKLTERMFGHWSKILAATSRSRLVMLLSEAAIGELKREFLPRLQKHSIDPARVQLIGRLKLRDYLRLFHRLDIVLDTQPYAGCTTTMDALWMGVPVVTMAGRTYVARVGVSILAQLGLEKELVAENDEQYVQIASSLAGNLPRLQELRATMRQRMKDSPLLDAKRVVSEFEGACRDLWRQWCGRQQPNTAVTK